MQVLPIPHPPVLPWLPLLDMQSDIWTGTYPACLANTEVGNQGYVWIGPPEGELIPGRVCRGSLLLTVLSGADGNLDDGVTDLCGRLSL